MPDLYFNRIKAELELYKKQKYNQPLMAIFANPPALLDIPEDQMEAIRRRNRDTQNAVSSDVLAPFAMMAVAALMEFGAGGFRASPKSVARGELPIGKNRSTPKSRSKEISKPKSEAPCISSTLMPGWQMALSHPDVFFGITQVAEASSLCQNWETIVRNKFSEHPGFKNLPLKESEGLYFKPQALKGGRPNLSKARDSIMDDGGNTWYWDRLHKNHFDVQIKGSNDHFGVYFDGTIKFSAEIPNKGKLTNYFYKMVK